MWPKVIFNEITWGMVKGQRSFIFFYFYNCVFVQVPFVVECGQYGAIDAKEDDGRLERLLNHSKTSACCTFKFKILYIVSFYLN